MILSPQDLDAADAKVTDILLNSEILEIKMTCVSESAPARYCNSGASIVVDAGGRIKKQVLRNALHAEA